MTEPDLVLSSINHQRQHQTDLLLHSGASSTAAPTGGDFRIRTLAVSLRRRRHAPTIEIDRRTSLCALVPLLMAAPGRAHSST